jgi:hypothetical protein
MNHVIFVDRSLPIEFDEPAVEFVFPTLTPDEERRRKWLWDVCSQAARDVMIENEKRILATTQSEIA